MPNKKYNPNPSLGSYHWQTITKDVVLKAIQATQTNAQAARFLGISKQTWKKYASMYYDEDGNNLYVMHNNKYCLGVKRQKIVDQKASYLADIVSGKIPATNFVPQELKATLLREGFLEEKCCHCGFNEQRVSDYKVPLLLVFRDGNKKNWNLDNLTLYCHNCYFLFIGEVYSRKQLKIIEGIENPKNGRIEGVLDLSHLHMKALEDVLSNKLQRDPEQNGFDPNDLIDTY